MFVCFLLWKQCGTKYSEVNTGDILRGTVCAHHMFGMSYLRSKHRCAFPPLVIRRTLFGEHHRVIVMGNFGISSWGRICESLTGKDGCTLFASWDLVSYAFREWKAKQNGYENHPTTMRLPAGQVCSQSAEIWDIKVSTVEFPHMGFWEGASLTFAHHFFFGRSRVCVGTWLFIYWFFWFSVLCVNWMFKMLARRVNCS